MNFVKKNKLVIIILLVTLVKGIIWAYATPPFQAPDEQVHYATIQFYAEPERYTPKFFNFPLYLTDSFNIKTQNLSSELRDYLEKTSFDKTRFNPETKFNFKDYLPFSGEGKSKADLSRFTESYPPWNTSYSPLYYQAAAFIENNSSGFGIAERSFFIRLFSVVLGAIFVFSAYLMFRELEINRKSAALLAGAVSFQPMLTFITASINVDAMLFAGFGVFLWGAVRLIKKADLIAVAALLAGTVFSISAKQSGYFSLCALIFLIILFALRNRDKARDLSKIKKIFLTGGIAAIATTGIYFVFLFYQWVKVEYLLGSHALSLIPAYISHQLEYPVFLGHSWFYWGNFGWLAIPIHRYYIYLLWVVMALAFVGMLKYLLIGIRRAAFPRDEKEKTRFYQVVFLIFAVVGFFLMIHAINFQQVNPNNVADESAAIAIQGRYFFPVMAAKFSLIFLGLCCLFSSIRKRTIALFLFSFMVILNLAGLFFYVIPRYYL